eukprot:scaffold82081_cov17-Tisochrysis_lutea.AAC.1
MADASAPACGDPPAGAMDPEFFIPEDAYDSLDETRARLLAGEAPDLKGHGLPPARRGRPASSLGLRKGAGARRLRP